MERLRFPRVRSPGSDRVLPKCRSCPFMRAEPEPVRPLGLCVIVLVRIAIAAKPPETEGQDGLWPRQF